MQPGSPMFILLASLALMLLSNECHGAAIRWDYATNDPSKWPGLFKKWCGNRMQSPIKLTLGESTYDADMPTYTITEPNLVGLKYHAYNDGHKIGIDFNGLMVNVTVPGHEGSCFRPHSIHWHWGPDDTHGSEHWVEGRHYPLEGHIVMWNCRVYDNFSEALDGFGGLAVLGIMLEPDSSITGVSAGLGSLLNLMSTNTHMQQCPECTNITYDPANVDMNAFTLNDLLPVDKSEYYLYSGSLTTPDCRENVMWTVFRQTIRVPLSVTSSFRSVRYPDGSPMVSNFRPALPLNPSNPFGARRMVARSFTGTTGGTGGLPSAAGWLRASPTGVVAAIVAFVAVALTR